MKKRMVWMLAAAMSVGLLAGCQKEEEPQEVKEEPVEEKVEEPVVEEPQVITLGTESEDAVLLSLKNSTGKEITGYWMRLSETEEEETGDGMAQEEQTEDSQTEDAWGDNMMTSQQTIPAGETFLVYYTPDQEESAAETGVQTEATAAEGTEEAAEETDTEGTDSQAEVQETMLCDISLGYADSSSVEIYELDLLDVDMTEDKYVELCADTEAAYVKYTSLSSGQMVDTKEAALARLAEENPQVLVPEDMDEEDSDQGKSDKKSSSGNKQTANDDGENETGDTTDDGDDQGSGSSGGDTGEDQDAGNENGGAPEDTGNEGNTEVPAATEVPDTTQQDTPPASSSSSTEGLTEECGHWFDAAGNEVYPE